MQGITAIIFSSIQFDFSTPTLVPPLSTFGILLLLFFIFGCLVFFCVCEGVNGLDGLLAAQCLDPLVTSLVKLLADPDLSSRAGSVFFFPATATDRDYTLTLLSLPLYSDDDYSGSQ